ncbi:MAG: hypothetical protein S4CHLAM81_04220 [Chlamydiales bacterium]|nr:hypothetical protein [Chlamydiales bacterium]MCH9635211.1 hypothetical protein [Chlamydiales bacterium]MCH9703181.1 hypothetical protein [Chlamydiota bacterium]
MEPARGIGSSHQVQPITRTAEVGKVFRTAFSSMLRRKLPPSGQSTAPSPVLIRSFAGAAKEPGRDSAISMTPPTKESQAYLTGDGDLEFEPEFPSQTPFEGDVEETYCERVENGYTKGSLTMVDLDLRAITAKETQNDLRRQANLLNGRQVSSDEYWKAVQDKPLVVSYSNQALVTPVNTEVFRRYAMPGVTMLSGNAGVAINYYQNDSGEDCIEGVWLSSIDSIAGEGRKELYHVEGRMDVNLSTRKAEVSWKILPVLQQEGMGRLYALQHHGEGGQAVHDFHL